VSARSQEIHGTVFLDPVWPRSYGLGMRLGLAGTTDCPDSITSQHFLSDLICCSSLLFCVHLVPPRPRSLSTCSFCTLTSYCILQIHSIRMMSGSVCLCYIACVIYGTDEPTPALQLVLAHCHSCWGKNLHDQAKLHNNINEGFS